jgi:hypothetical protein
MQKNLGKKKNSDGKKHAADKHGKGGRVTKKGTSWSLGNDNY